jgi:hypothetical protein
MVWVSDIVFVPSYFGKFRALAPDVPREILSLISLSDTVSASRYNIYTLGEAIRVIIATGFVKVTFYEIHMVASLCRRD